MSRSGPYWKNETTWVCPRHLPSVKIPANIERCFYVNCSSVRPERVEPIEPVPLPSTRKSAASSRTATKRTVAKSPSRSGRGAVASRPVKAPPAPQPVVAAAAASAEDEPAFNAAGHKLCAWFKCDKGENGGRAVTRTRSKYCSRDCSNRNARWRHKNR